MTHIAILLSLLFTITCATVHEDAKLFASVDTTTALPFTYPGGFGYVAKVEDTVLLHLHSYDDIYDDSVSYDITPSGTSTIPNSVTAISDVGLKIRFRDLGYVEEAVVYFDFDAESVDQYGPYPVRVVRDVETGNDDQVSVLRKNEQPAGFVVFKGNSDGFEGFAVNVTSPLIEGLTQPRDLYYFGLAGDWIAFPFDNIDGTTNITFYDYVNDITRYAMSPVLASYAYNKINLVADATTVYMVGNDFKVYWCDTTTWEEGEYDPTYSWVNYYPDTDYLGLVWMSTGYGGFLHLTTQDDNYHSRYYALATDGSTWDPLMTGYGDNSYICDQTSSFCYGVEGSNPVTAYKIESLGRFASQRTGFTANALYPSVNGILDEDVIVVRGTGYDVFVLNVNNITDIVLRSEGEIENYAATYATPCDRDEGVVLFVVQDETSTDFYIWSMDNRFENVEESMDETDMNNETGGKDLAGSVIVSCLLGLAYLL